ncbi:MAG: TetR/AcrR family transcriptional regulator [Anaerolineales bacterium]|nr:TetR/AcrR family transcriptional regulator [Anaerolineales bacterium]
MPKQTFLNLPDEKRQTVVNAAIDEFAEYGFESASINRIVANSGISKGSFYQYFEDKMDVFKYLMDVIAQEKTEFFKGKHPPSPGQSIFGYFRWMIKTGMEFNSTNPKLVKAIARVLLSEGMYYGQIFADVRKKTMDTLVGMIQSAKQNGEIDASVDEKVAAKVMDTWSNVISNSILEEGMQKKDIVKWVRAPKTQKYIDDMLSIMEHGLRNVKASSSDDDGKEE